MGLEIACVRWRGNVGNVGDGKGYSRKISLKLLFEPRDVWVGVYWTRGDYGHFYVYLCLLPCLPIRFHLVKATGAGLYKDMMMGLPEGIRKVAQIRGVELEAAEVMDETQPCAPAEDLEGIRAWANASAYLQLTPAEMYAYFRRYRFLKWYCLGQKRQFPAGDFDLWVDKRMEQFPDWDEGAEG